MIESHPEQQLDLSTLSQIAGMNRNKLTYGFKKLTGKSIHQFVIKIRMENAKLMLAANDKPIKAIALLNGYSNTENFINAFKKYCGITPSHFLNKKNDNQ